MTYQQFMDTIQSYYGGYPKDSKVPSYVMSYLTRHIREDKLKRLFQFITFSHAVRFGAPDISDFEKAIYQAARSGQVDDVHKTLKVNTKENIQPLTDVEYKKGTPMFDIVKSALRGKKVEKP